MRSRTRPSAKEMETPPPKSLPRVCTHRHVHTHSHTQNQAMDTAVLLTILSNPGSE